MHHVVRRAEVKLSHIHEIYKILSSQLTDGSGIGRKCNKRVKTLKCFRTQDRRTIGNNVYWQQSPALILFSPQYCHSVGADEGKAALSLLIKDKSLLPFKVLLHPSIKPLKSNFLFDKMTTYRLMKTDSTMTVTTNFGYLRPSLYIKTWTCKQGQKRDFHGRRWLRH